MKYIQTMVWLVTISLSLFSVASAEEKTSAILESISFERDADNTETVNFKLNGIHLPKIFAIKGEKPRVVFDFLDTKYSNLINSVIDTEGDLVKRVRVGIHNEPTPKTRVVVDLAPQSDFNYEHDFIVQDNVLTISIFDPAEEKSDEQVADVEQVKQEVPEKTVAEEAPEPVMLKQETTKMLVEADEEIEPASVVEKTEDVAETMQEEVTVEQEPPSPAYPSADEVFGGQTQEQQEEILPEQEVVEAEQQQFEQSNPRILDITFEDSSNKGEMVLFKLNDFYPPIVFGIEKGNPRVVCDFLNSDLAEGVDLLIDSSGVYIDKIRTAKHKNPDKVRVVLDLVPNKNYDLQQVFFKEDNLFVIIVNSFDEEISSLYEDENTSIN